MNITRFDKTNVKALQAEAVALLASLGTKYGVQITQAGGSLGDVKATLKFNFAILGEDAERVEFNEDAHLFDCKPEHYGKTAVILGETQTLIGFAPRRSSYPIRLRDSKGKTMLYRESVLRHFIPGFREAVTPATPTNFNR